MALPIHSKLLDIVIDTTIPYKGPGGPIELQIYTQILDVDGGFVQSPNIISWHDVSSGPVVKGNKDTDFDQTTLANFCSRGMFMFNWAPSVGTDLYVVIRCNGSLSDLTQGSTTFYITYIRYP